MLSVEAEVHVVQLVERAEEQARPGQQDHGERDFGGEEDGAQPDATALRASTRPAEQMVGASPSCEVQGGAEPEERAHGSGDAHAEEQHVRVHADPGHAWDAVGRVRPDDLEDTEREEQPDRSSDRGQDHALRGDLPEQPASRRAERRPHGDLAAAGRGPHEQQVGGVRAHDEEHEAHGPEHDPETSTHVADLEVDQRLIPEPLVDVGVGELAWPAPTPSPRARPSQPPSSPK